MTEVAKQSPARPAVVLGLTFLLLGATFALPFALLPNPEDLFGGKVSPEVANVYAIAAWAGWAHFLYAFRGQGQALSRLKDPARADRLIIGVLVLSAVIAGLAFIRSSVGVGLFSAVVWIYFIDHFLKAELSFEGRSFAADASWRRWIYSYQPLIAFTWLSIVLLDVGQITSHQWLLWTVSIVLATLFLFTSGLRDLGLGSPRNPLLALFFLAEALVWGTFSRYGGSMFNTGVYIFHIAAGSHFHYLGCYYVGQARSKDWWLSATGVLLVNLTVIGVGVATAYLDALRWLRPILGVEWFTLWVGVHLVASDLFPYIKRSRLTLRSD
ncbi:MAG TPA: hypothetical protein PKA27_09435 [Fimbriimonadaceae bacterium]|nr:hypothetical protein [Fimbriimonadaceae bacterium]